MKLKDVIHQARHLHPAFSHPQKMKTLVIMNVDGIMFKKAVVQAPDRSYHHFAAAAAAVPVVARCLLDAAALNLSVHKTVPSGHSIPP